MAAFMLCAHVALPYLQGGEILSLWLIASYFGGTAKYRQFFISWLGAEFSLSKKKSLLLVVSNNAGQVVLAYFAN